MSYTLKGSYDLHITSICNLHCAHCGALDYMGKDLNIVDKFTYDDIETLIQELTFQDIRFEELKLMGGEPTLCKDFDRICSLLKQSSIADHLILITNGLNLTEDIVRTCCTYLDEIRVSIYPMTKSLPDAIDASPMGAYIRDRIRLQYWMNDTFELQGQEIEGEQYSKELNWSRCYQKDKCKVIAKDGLYRCTTSYAEKKEMYTYDDIEHTIEMMEQDYQPLDLCEQCPQPAKRMNWDTNNSPVDLRNLARGIAIIKNTSIV